MDNILQVLTSFERHYKYGADNELFPLAYVIISEKEYGEWAWFLQNIKEIARRIELTIVSISE